MDKETKEELRKGLSNVFSEAELLIKNLIPNKRGSNTESIKKEAVKTIITILKYLEKKQREVSQGKKIIPKEIFSELNNIYGVNVKKDELKNALKKLPFNDIDKIAPLGTNFREYIKFINNLIKDSYKKNKSKELKDLFSDLNFSPIMVLFQFLASKFWEIDSFLFKKPFRFTSKSMQNLINSYETLMGYFETFIRLIVIADDLIYKEKKITNQEMNKVFKRRFMDIIKLGEKINNFEIFLVPYDNTLRNKIIHKDYYIDYNNKKIKYANKEIDFKQFLNNSREILLILFSWFWIFHFDVRNTLEKACNILDKYEKNE